MRPIRQRSSLISPPCPFPDAIHGIGIFTPARPAGPKPLTTAIRRFRKWGLTVLAPSPEGAATRYLAGSETGRTAPLHELLRNPQIQILMAARGGYGCARLFEHLDWDLLRACPKPIIGYSDLTALHLACLRHGIRTGISGPMAAVEFARTPSTAVDRQAMAFTFRSLADVWQPQPTVGLPPKIRLQGLKPGQVEAPVVPATLSVLVSLLGTPWLPELADTILVIEDVNEPAYKIDRYLTQLRQAGILPRLAGLILGSFNGGDDAEWLPEIFAEFAAFIPGPVAAGLPFGHCWPMVSVPVGRPAFLGVAPAGKVTLRW